MIFQSPFQLGGGGGGGGFLCLGFLPTPLFNENILPAPSGNFRNQEALMNYVSEVNIS